MDETGAIAHVWLSPSELDFGAERNATDVGEATVWLHSDAHAVFGVRVGADATEIRRAYRRVVREHHPDAPSGSTAAFWAIQQAARTIFDGQQPDVAVEPTSGKWWTFVEFATPEPTSGSDVLVGLTFDVHDLAHVPLRHAVDEVHVSYGDIVLPLTVSYSRSHAALPVLRAKAAVMSEAALLTLLCLALIPLLAVGLALEVFFLSAGSAVLTWLVGLLIVVGGYGMLAWALWSTGRPIPYPRRAVSRVRSAYQGMRSLPPARG
jgi:DnaJ domain